MSLIEIRSLSKRFVTKTQTIDALKDIDLNIEKGDVYGIIGMSGAGKSTLVRCINYLEKPTKGEVYIEGAALSGLTEKELRALRGQIGMIFQNFNLLMQKSVLENVLFPLKIQGMPRAKALARAKELLKTVDLADRGSAYPAQLSGGQKQRVAIARALATEPKILLCDEATSALDPQTTQSILALLRRINQEMGITIVVITHQMSVVREICSRVAIIEDGSLAEEGLVEEIFTHPKSRAARRLIIEGKEPEDWADEDPTDDIPEEPAVETAGGLYRGNEAAELMEDRRIRIVFTTNSSYEPVIGNMVLRFGTPVNILFADTHNVGGVARGEMILGLPEDPGMQEAMIEYLTEHGLAVEEVPSDVER